MFKGTTMMAPPQRPQMPAKSPQSKTGKKRSFDMVLTAIKMDLMRDYELYEEALLSVIRVKTWGGDATAWYNQMGDLVRGKPLAEMSHEGVKFLIEEMVKDFAAEGFKATQPSQ